jgi:hypothetical protein
VVRRCAVAGIRRWAGRLLPPAAPVAAWTAPVQIAATHAPQQA